MLFFHCRNRYEPPQASEPGLLTRVGMIAIAAGVLALTACSSANLAYSTAPTIIAGEFDDAFNLNGEQADLLDERLQRFFDWHRREELARYRTLLERAANDASDGFSAQEFAVIVREVRTAWNRAVEQMIDDLGGLGATLSPVQIEHFRWYYAETREEYDEYLELDDEERREYRAERSLERLEKWYGGFDRELEQRILARLQTLPDTRESWLRYRKARVEEMLRIFSTTSDPETIKVELRDLMLNPEHPVVRDFEPKRAAYWRAYGEMLEEINAWMTPEQRQKAIDQLQKYARMVAEIEPQG